MKILFMGDYPPSYGGISSHLFDLLPGLVERGFKVVTLTESNVNMVKENDNIKNIFVSLKSFFIRDIFSCVFSIFFLLSIKNDLKWMQYFRAVVLAKLVKKTCDKEKAGMIFVYDNDRGLIIPILRSLNCNIPISLMIFGHFYTRSNIYLNIKKYYYDVLNKSDFLMASSQYCADSTKNVLGYNFNHRVVYVGVDENIYSPALDDNKTKLFLNIPDSSFVYFFLGRMVKEMGIDILLENAKEILNISENVYLIMAGAHGDYSRDVKRLSDVHNRLLYFENIPFEQKIDFYHACDVYLAPTMQKQACMGVSIKEAMACGKPVIASTSGGIPEAVEDGISGYLIPIENGRMKDNVFLDRARNLYNESSLRKKMGDKGREIVIEKFTNEKTVKRYLDIIAELS